MPTTTIRLPEDLKRRIAMAAERKGTSPHAFMLGALAERVSENERRDDLHATAERRYAVVLPLGGPFPGARCEPTGIDYRAPIQGICRVIPLPDYP